MPPDNKQAQYVTNQIRRLGVQDVQLFYDNQVNLWAVCQVKQVAKTLVTLDNPNLTDLQPHILWWCRQGRMGLYRPPGEQDISDVIATVQRAEVIFKKSESNPDWLDDQLLDEEKVKKEVHDIKQKERLKYIARTTNMRKHIQRELGEKMNW